MDISHISRPALMGQLHTHKQKVPRVEEKQVQDVIDVVERSKGNNVGEITDDIVATANHEIKKNDGKFWLTAMATALAPVVAIASPPIAAGVLLLGVGKAGYHLLKSSAIKQQAGQAIDQIGDRAKEYASNLPGMKGAHFGSQALLAESAAPSQLFESANSFMSQPVVNSTNGTLTQL